MQSDGPERIDYQETPDVSEIHAAVKREHSEPRADVTPIPLWLTIVCGVAIFWAGLYVGIFNGGFSSSVYDEYMSSPLAIFSSGTKTGAAVEEAGEKSLAEQGRAVYANCQSCHQANGQGLAGQFPPLAGSEWVNTGEKRIIAILLKGLQGPVVVEGKQFNGAMPAWEKTLTDKKIAAVASYVRSEWGNTAPEITPEKVAAARKEFASQSAPWTMAELEKIPADATFEGVAVAAAPTAQPKPDAAAAAPAESSASVPPPAAGAAPAPAAADPKQMELGKKTYMTVCFACHQPTGLGLPPVFPPLTKSEYVNGTPERFAAMVLKGNMGPMTVAGVAYNNLMPGLEAQLSDEQIAAVMTYVRANFDNAAGPVSPEVVKAAREKHADRKTPWTEAELKAWKE